jgi:hypothetical protein
VPAVGELEDAHAVLGACVVLDTAAVHSDNDTVAPAVFWLSLVLQYHFAGPERVVEGLTVRVVHDELGPGALLE